VHWFALHVQVLRRMAVLMALLVDALLLREAKTLELAVRMRDIGVTVAHR